MRLVQFLLIAMLAVFFTACGSNEPKEVAMEYEKAMMKGEVKKLISLINISEEEKKQHSKEIEGKLLQMTAQAEKQVQAKGGFDKIEFIEEQSDENKSVVNLKIHFKDGSNINDRVRLEKVNGAWKVRL